MHKHETVELLLATYNSESYLPELLASLAEQTMSEFTLVVSDDGSQDQTLAIIEGMRCRFKNPVRILDHKTPSGSAMRNFGRLLEASSADYVMLVDHDDIWHPDKVARGLELIRQAEMRSGTQTPTLAHSDLAVIDDAGQPSASSFWAMKQIDPACSKELRRTLIHASVVGCTTTLNRALVQASTPIPDDAIMHDWWISLIAAAMGAVVFDSNPRINYRIHGNNVSNPTQASATNALGNSNRRALMQSKIALRAKQAEALALRLEKERPEAALLARKFAQIPDQGFVSRRYSIFRNGFLFPGIWRNLAMAIAA